MKGFIWKLELFDFVERITEVFDSKDETKTYLWELEFSGMVQLKDS